MPSINPNWLRAPETRAVLDALAPAAPLFVGGCVRDALLGVEASDVDLCVTTPPAATTELLERAGLRAIPTGAAHGTVTALAGGRAFEVTTLRRDVETDGRHAVVAFTEDVVQDAARRDFTVNALYADAAGAVRDPLGGLPDLAAGRVRFIGDAATRIREDYLRVLRFFRFTARLCEPPEPDPEGLAACAAAVDGLDGLARERVGAEMRGLLSTSDPRGCVAAMARIGALQSVLPGADAAALDAFVTAERAALAPPDWRGRLAALRADDAVAALRLSRADAKAVGAVMRAAEAPVALAAHLYGVEAARAGAVLAASRANASPPADLEAALAAGAAAEFPLTGADLIAAGAPPGPEIGATLDRLRERWAESGFSLDRSALLDRL